jgi:hypothetical protein
MMKLTADQVRAYFEVRLSGQTLTRSGANLMARCPFHDDRRASLSLNLGKAVWICHAGCGQGGLVDFEKKLLNCDDATAMANIAGICGLADQGLFQQKPEAAYRYRDEDGNVLFEKLRYPGKRFSQRAKDQDGKPIYRLDGIRKVLYNLPDVITANHVAICEGEKDCNNLNAQGLAALDETARTRFVATTNFDGAGHWRPEYAPYLAGKHVVIFPDNDPAGKAHALDVASSVFPYARSVKIAELPGLAQKGDVSDFLRDHSAKELLTEVKKATFWKPSLAKLLVRAPEFLSNASPKIEWLVDSVIERGASGFICSLPKAGKSWLGADLALSLALGLPFLGLEIPRPVKTALITREDNPALTKWRMNRLLRGKQRAMPELEGRLYVNSREQSPEFRLDRPELLTPMIVELKRVEPEFVILDVFNVLHSSDENDNTEMCAVLEELNRLRREAGCSIGVVHHFSKHAEGTLTQRIRGAGAIAGWAEWCIGIEADSKEPNVRRMEFELKAAFAPEPLCYTVRNDELAGSTRIERVPWVAKKAKRQRAADILDMGVSGA